MALTERQKEAQRKYRESKKYITVGLTYKSDIIEGRRLKSYLESSGQSANAYIKSLIKADLDAKGIPYPGPEDAPEAGPEDAD